VNDKAIGVLAAATVAVTSTYEDRNDAVLFGIALGLALAETPKSAMLYRTAVSILAGDPTSGAISVENADTMLHKTADALLAHL